MAWLYIGIIALAIWLVGREFRRSTEVLIGIRDRLTAIQNTQTLLFYAVEQIYEMSGVYSRFKATQQAESDTFGRDPILNVDDEASVAAWSTLMQRVQGRVETAVRLQYRDSEPAEDPDQMFAQGNWTEWVARLPMLRGWPKHPHVCWWGTQEKAPADVPRFNKQRD
ncbi:MAG TPA: hypothetical protein VNR20_02860 [Terriglobales bacterium]|nr:hypothetical protein [Terriglobales bacterium]